MTRSTTAANGGGQVTRGWDYDAGNRAIAAWVGAASTASTLRARWDYDACTGELVGSTTSRTRSRKRWRKRSCA